MRSRTVLLGAVVALTLGVVPAGADGQKIEDERNKDQALDLIAASHGHNEHDPAILVHELELAEPPDPPEELRGAGLRINIPNGMKGLDRVVEVRRNPDGSLRAAIEGRGVFWGFANAYWADETTIRIEFPVRTLRPAGINFYRWKAFISYPCPESVICVGASDAAPDRGKIKHRL